ncbi:MAG: TauD/TfdA family dioxygenase [Alphaproteobacteria bacterium]|nr:TauD/TfdA family dioxygenase [Alphaproteobacteria bacterium]
MTVAAMRHDFEIQPLTPRLGAEVTGVDLAQPLDDQAFALIRDAFDRRLVLVFRDQHLPEPAHIAFSRRFGALEVHVLNQYLDTRFPELYVISNVGPDGKPRGVHPDRGTMVWHTDLSFTRVPSYATILYGVEIATTGGDTMFADMLSAYEALPEATKTEIAGLRAVHDLDVSRRKAGDDPLTADQRAKAPPVDHPVVRLHGPSGRRGLYLGSHASHIEGWPQDKGEALIRQLVAHATEKRFVYRHRWRHGDLVMWDNRATLHRATDYDTGNDRRIVRRTVVTGEVPVPG